jgi:hypothetical protein
MEFNEWKSDIHVVESNLSPYPGTYKEFPFEHPIHKTCVWPKSLKILKKRNSENEEICLDIMISYVKFVGKN